MAVRGANHVEPIKKNYFFNKNFNISYMVSLQSVKLFQMHLTK